MLAFGDILPLDSDDSFYTDASIASFIVEQILDINRIDEGINPEEREPIRLYINSPGGDVTEGFALISAIEISKTPVYTINMGQWSSMTFLIGIAGLADDVLELGFIDEIVTDMGAIF